MFTTQTTEYEEFKSCLAALNQRQSRFRLLSDLLRELNLTFLRTGGLDELLQAVLVAITSGDGLGFNRAFLIKLHANENMLKGAYAIGPSSVEEAYRIWSDIALQKLSLFDICNIVRDKLINPDTPINKLAKTINISMDNEKNALVIAIKSGIAFKLSAAGSRMADLNLNGLEPILNGDDFIIAPLLTGGKPYGLILADNFVTKQEITDDNLEAVELFSHVASLAIGKNLILEKLTQHIEELVSVNEKAEKHRQLLIETEQYNVIGRMADQLLHEIKNPLTSMGGMALLLERKLTETPDLQKFASSIAEQAKRIEKVLNDVFQLTEPQKLQLQDVDIEKLVQEAVSIYRSELKKHGITIELTSRVSPVVLPVDKMMLRQSLFHILKNASDAMPDGGNLKIEIDRHDPHVILSFADTGIGIAKAHIRQADLPFFTTKTSGMGLGLSFVKRVAGFHNGDLAISSNDTGGTTITLRLSTNSPES